MNCCLSTSQSTLNDLLSLEILYTGSVHLNQVTNTKSAGALILRNRL